MCPCDCRCYYALNPDSAVGGVLQQDWTTPESSRLSFLKPFLAAPFQNIDPYGLSCLPSFSDLV